MTVGVPGWLADGAAKLMQRGPGSARTAEEIAFAEIPAATADVTIPTRHGEVAATVYAPPGGSAGRGVHVNLHGGGFVLRHPEQDDPICRYLAAHAGVTVINVDYTPAPQLRAPGAVEQALDVTRWAAAPERPWDGSRPTVGGASAGGALAAGVARLAWEEGAPPIALQVLLYPPLDLTVPARTKFGPGRERYLVPLGPFFDKAYAPDPHRRGDRLVSPAGPQDTVPLGGIAPALVITCEKDILRAEGIRYAERLDAAGALREHVDVPGVGHGFNILGSPRALIVDVYDRIAAHLRAAGTPDDDTAR
ncbi:alpha/beta hydrolase fold domain-containing protein [Microbacterium sp.]|uniref:alpha/beta hydrolase fold domain-containing protein n=1 Tax=Microbacterium sp. TaxID=51671 RepID=UPI0039E4465D